jgi:hypothetical protein
MKILMNTALDDMKKDGVVFSCLAGQRQRYEYFGFTHTGSAYTFDCRTANITHVLGGGWNSGLSLKQVEAGDAVLLDKIQTLHDEKKSRLRRDREKLFDILSSWNALVFAVIEKDNFEGYFIYKADGNNISEINLKNGSRIAEVIGLFLRRQTEFFGRDSVKVCAMPHEPEKIAALANFAEDYSQGSAYGFAVFDYQRFVDAFIRLKSQNSPPDDGAIVIQVEGRRIRLFAKGGAAGAEETQAEADIKLDRLEALRFLFSPLETLTNPAIGKNAFLRSILPLPLFFEEADGV